MRHGQLVAFELNLVQHSPDQHIGASSKTWQIQVQHTALQVFQSCS